MPATLTYPGVYVEEIPSGVRTITGVATSIAALIGRTLRGPVNEPVTINGFGDFERRFGGLWVESPLSFAVRDFYQNLGSQAIIVRVYRPHFATEPDRDAALEAAQAVSAACAAAQAPAEAAATAAAGEVAAAAITAAAAVVATPASVVAAVRTEADKPANGAEPRKSAADAVAKAAEAAAAVTQPAATPASVKDGAAAAIPTAVNSSVSASLAAAARTEANLPANNAEPRKSAADTVAKAAEAAATQPNATPAAVKSAADAAVSQAAPITKARLAADSLNLEAANEGAWGNRLRVRVDHDVKGPDAPNLFNLSIQDGATGQVEVVRNLSIQAAHVRRVDKVLAKESQLVRVRGPLPTALPAKHTDLTAGQNPFDPATSSGVVTGGEASDGLELVTANYEGSESKKEGIYALDKADLFNLLCIPPYSPATDVEKPLWSRAATYCEKRRALLLVDSPSSWKSKDSAKGGLDGDIGVAHKNAAIFFPRLKLPNPLRDGQIEEFASCGAVAGVVGRTDTQRGVWKAPAGLEATLIGVPDLSVPLTDAENGELNPLGINCLRTLPVAGRVVWGARTLVGDDRLASEWKYIPVRRVALFIEESLYRGTQWVVFEPNDEPLWAQIRLNIGAFLQNMFRQGAFQGRSPREAYFVKCDKETTTQSDINLGIVNIVVGFAPLKPAEFVVIKIQQMAGQIQT